MTDTRRDEQAQGLTEEVLAAEETFFGSLLNCDIESLETVLSADFVIVDVRSGDVADRSTLVEAMRSELLTFTAIERDLADVTVRLRPGVAVAVGRTALTMQVAGQQPATTPSRYTHVYSRDDGRWRLMSAQGTPLPSSSHG